MSQGNMYRVAVGDFVFFEQSPGSPYLIRKIDELTMTPNKNVEARCLCFYRRRDLPANLLVMADRYQSFYDVEPEDEGDNHAGTTNGTENNSNSNSNSNELPSPEKKSYAKENDIIENGKLSPRQIHRVKHRELYISRTVETLPATGIRGKCTVTLLNDEENLQSYLSADDAFFYSLKYDPQQKTLNTDRGDIKVGSKYQVDHIPQVDKAAALARSSEEFETLVWDPAACSLTDEQISQFTIVAKAVGLYARAVDVNSTVRNPSLHQAAIMASRDSILQFTASTLHKANYDLAEALKFVVPSSGPCLVRDQLEEWSPAEAALFEEGMEKYGKDFENIRQDLLPWKSMRSMIEFYYIWKTTDRYQNRRKQKASENENKMKQVYIPAHTKPNPALIVQNKASQMGLDMKPMVCESCATSESAQWYAWSPNSTPNPNVPQNLTPQGMNSQHKLCQNCWLYWKKYGGLKQDSTRLDGAAGRPDPTQRAERVHQMQQTAVKKMVPCQVPDCQKAFRNRHHMLRHLYNQHEVYIDEAGQMFPLIKTPSAFVMTTHLATMLMRRLLARGTVQLARVQRNPTQPIDFANVHKEYGNIVEEVKKSEAKRIKLRSRKPHFLATGLRRLNVDLTQPNPDWLQRRGDAKQPARFAFPKPDKMPWPQDQQPLNDHKGQQPPIMRKRNCDAASISPLPNSKQPREQAVSILAKQEPSVATNLAIKTETATNLTTGGPQHHNGVGPPPAKQQHLSTQGSTSNRTSNSRPPVHYPQQGQSSSNGQRKATNGNGPSSTSANVAASEEFSPEDMFFVITNPVASARKVLNAQLLRRACRRPFAAIRPVTDGVKSAPGSTAGSTSAAVAAMDTSSNNSHSNSAANGSTNGVAGIDHKLNQDGRTAMVVD